MPGVGDFGRGRGFAGNLVGGFSGVGSLGRGTEAAHRAIRAQIEYLESDRPLYPDLDRMADMIRSGEIVGEVEGALAAPLTGAAEMAVKRS